MNNKYVVTVILILIWFALVLFTFGILLPTFVMYPLMLIGGLAAVTIITKVIHYIKTL